MVGEVLITCVLLTNLVDSEHGMVKIILGSGDWEKATSFFVIFMKKLY